MNTKKILNILFVALSFIWTGCEDDKEIFFEELITEEKLDRVHPNDRDKPYPREEHELYINPAPLIVPEAVKEKDDFLEFELSQDENFPEEGTFRSGKVRWHMYNVHQELAVGTWFWRYRVVDKNGKATLWSVVNKFNVTGQEPVFVTPPFSEMKKKLPVNYPRLHCYLDDDLKKVLPNIQSHEEYRKAVNRANSAVGYDFSKQDDPYGFASSFAQINTQLYAACRLTSDEKYQNAMVKMGQVLGDIYLPDNNLFKGNFYVGDMVSVLSEMYDIANGRLTENQRRNIEDVILRSVKYYYRQYLGRLENDIFDNHTWQAVLRSMFQGAFMIYDRYPEELLPVLEYFYEVWTARAPATGFNRDGGWINGVSYFITNTYTLCYMPMMFSYLTGTDFLQHPWYKNAGKAMVYSWLPESAATGFGDNSGPNGWPFRTRLAFADFIARELGDSYAAWYANNDGGQLKEDITIRLYRMARSYKIYENSLNENEVENFVWYKDMGEGVACSDMLHPNQNMALAFRSSPFGSGSHTLADQNSFKLIYNGKAVYINSGYYDGFTGKHTLLHHKHTRGSNSILVNGIGQPLTTRAYGNIERGLNSDHVAYFLGDASNAYCGTSEYSMWIDAYAGAGISQTPEYGLGETPLNKYKRHLFMLRPNIVVVYDDLGADEPATWQWLLHSEVEFDVKGNKLTTKFSDFISVAQIFSEQTPVITTTNEWFPGGEPSWATGDGSERQWHMTATFGPSMQNKVLTIIQLNDDTSQIQDVWRANNNFRIGDWKIVAEMDGNESPAIKISNEELGVMFDYGSENLLIDGTFYQRQIMNSAVLFDTVHGVTQTQESVDKPVQSTRAIK